MGFEPTRAEPIGLAVQRLNHSATSSCVLQRVFCRLLIACKLLLVLDALSASLKTGGLSLDLSRSNWPHWIKWSMVLFAIIPLFTRLGLKDWAFGPIQVNKIRMASCMQHVDIGQFSRYFSSIYCQVLSG